MRATEFGPLLRWGALALVAMTGLSACSLAPAYELPLIRTPAAYRDIGPWTPATPGLPRGSWWGMFGDPTLDGLEMRLLANNPTLAASYASYQEAEDQADEISASMFPFLSLGGSATGNRQSEQRPLRGANEPNQYGANNLGLSAYYEFDFWGRVRNLVAEGQAAAEASEADLAEAQLSLEATLADDYMNLRGLDARRQMLTDTVVAYQRALDLVTTRHGGGVASGLDLDRAETQLYSAKAQLSDAIAARALYQHAIAALVGASAADFDLGASVTEPAIPLVPVGVPATLIERRPDVAAAERAAFAANAGIGVARAAFFPTITLDASAGFQNTGSVNLLTLPDSVWTLGPSLALPIFEAGRLNAALDAARASFAKASAEYRGTVLTAFQQVADNLSLANELAEESTEEHQAMQAALASENLSLLRYRDGIVNYLDVVTAQTAALEAEQSYIGLTTRRETAAVNLIRALGGGWRRSELSKT